MIIDGAARGLVRESLFASGRLLGPRRAERLGRTIHRGLRLVGPNAITSNGECLVMDAAAAIADEGSHFFDVGANVGDWAELMIERIRPSMGQRLHCFEPSPTTFRSLQENVRLNNHPFVSLVNLGLSDSAGAGELGIIHDGAGSNSIHRQSNHTETIVLERADDYCVQNRIEKLALIKLDIEGHEISALEGCSNLLKDHRVGLVQFEYTWRWIDARRYLRDAFELFGQSGYEIYRISRFGFHPVKQWQPGIEDFWEVNYLAVSPALGSREKFQHFVRP